MAFDFPASPTNGQVFTPPSGPTYTYDLPGTKWLVTGTGLSGLSVASTTDVLTGTSSSVAVTPDALAALWEKGTNVASAATITFPEGGYFHVTGTVTITDIDWATATNGRWAWVVFDTALTLTHSATLLLPGNANILTQANDRACFVQDASDNVICLTYQRATSKPLEYTSAGNLTVFGTSPQISLTDMDNGYDCIIDGNSATLTLNADANNEAGTAGGIILKHQNVTYYTLANAISAFLRNAGSNLTVAGTVMQVQRIDTTPASGMYLVQFTNSATTVGSIVISTGGNTTAYNTTSDMRMKDVASRRPIDDSGEIIDKLEPVYFKWPGDPLTEDFGFFAQEVVEVPQVAHTVAQGDTLMDRKPGDPGFEPWGMEHGRMEAILVAELQSVRARLAALEAAQSAPASRKK